MVAWPPKNSSGEVNADILYVAGVDGNSAASVNPRAWFSGFRIQEMTWNATSWLCPAVGMDRNEPPMLAPAAGPAATRHLPLVSGAACEMSRACQAAPTSVSRVPLPIAPFQLSSLILASTPIVNPLTAVFQACL